MALNEGRRPWRMLFITLQWGLYGLLQPLSCQTLPIEGCFWLQQLPAVSCCSSAPIPDTAVPPVPTQGYPTSSAADVLCCAHAAKPCPVHRAHVRMWLYLSPQESPENKVAHKCWHWFGGPGRGQVDSDGGAVEGQQPKNWDFGCKRIKGDCLSHFPCLAFGFEPLELNYPAFPTLVMPRN